jgi:hypothetical protein
MKTNKKKLGLDLLGLDGNAFMLLGYFRKQAKRTGWSVQDIEKVTKDAQSGDYDHLLQVLMSV